MDLKSSVNTQASLRNWCQVTLSPSLQWSQLLPLLTQTERGPRRQRGVHAARPKAAALPQWLRPRRLHRDLAGLSCLTGSLAHLVPGIFPTASELHPSLYLTCLVWASLPLSPLPSSEFWNLSLPSDPSLGFWALRQHWVHNQ